MSKFIGGAIFTILMVITLSDLEGMRGFFNIFSWIHVSFMGICATFLLGVTLLYKNPEVHTATLKTITWIGGIFQLISMGVIFYIMYTYNMEVQLTLCIISHVMYWLSLLICMYRK